MKRPRFVLLTAEGLLPHEEVERDQVASLAREIHRVGFVDEPIWVARGERIILNGHHRYAALRRLGAARVPAWLIEYGDPEVTVERWAPGPPLSKREIVERARAGRPFPPKTSRHRLPLTLPRRATPLTDLMAQRGAARRVRARAQPGVPRFSRVGARSADAR